jgi:hypothetical protein
MGLPARRKPQRSGIERAPRREWPKHEQFVRRHCCCVENAECEGRIEFAHVRQDHLAGVGQKPFSWAGISLCHQHHINVQHTIGHTAFDKRYGIDSTKLAAEFAARSPDTEMRNVMSATLIGER